MFMDLMISRLCRPSALAAALVGSALLTVSCQKVPLLAPSGSTITLTAAATALPVNGSTDIIAQVIEAGGTPPHSGTLITFTTNLGTIQPSEAETDLSGRVTVKYYAGSGSGTATVTALSGGVSAGGTNAIKIAVGAAAVGGIGLSANPTTLPANGGTTTIAAVVNDSGGNPPPGVPVTFSTDNGSLGTSVVTTDGNGRAATTLATSRTAKVTATAGVATTSGTTTTAASTNTVTVTVNAAATVAFGTFSPATAVAGQPVSFTLTITPSATGGVIQAVVVNFGDGRSQTLGAVSGATPLSHTYDSPGTYTLTATATDSNGDAFSAAAGLTVATRPPANVTIVANPVSPQVGQPVAFTVTTTFPTANTALVQSVSIDFGDGTSAQPGAQTTAIAQHVYSTAGTYTATALVRDTNGGSTSSQTQVIVGARSQLAVTISSSTTSPTTGSSTSFAITATPTAGNAITSIVVDFGDGSAKQTFSGNTTSVQRVYTASGTFTVTATATDSSTATGSASMVVLVSAKPQLAVTISSATTTPTVGTVTSFTIGATASTGSAITSINIDFGDGTAQTLQGNATSVQRTYTAAGTYIVKATATDASGATGSASMVVTVAARPQLAVTVTAPTGTNAVANSPATFTLAAAASTTSASIVSIVVDFGNGSSTTITGNATSIATTYTAAGTYTVTATATDTTGATGRGSASVIIGAALLANFTYSQSASGNRTLAFNGTTSQGITATTTFTWDFGDGTALVSGPASSTATTTHPFLLSQLYPVRLTISEGGRTSQ